MADKLEIKVTGSKGTPIIIQEAGPLEMNVQSAPNENMNLSKEELQLQIMSSVAGAKADSLYDIAVRNGYTGTEAEFLEWYRVKLLSTTGDSTTEGMTQKAITDELNLIKSAVFPLQLTFTRSGSSVLEYTGTSQNVTLSWTVKRNGVYLIPTSVSINGVEQTAAPSGSVTMSVNTLGTTTFTLSVTADGLTDTATAQVQMVLPMFMGFYVAGATVNTMSASLTKVVKSSPAGTYTYTNDSNTKYLTICIPSTMNINTVKSSGFDVPMQQPVTDNSMTIGGAVRTYKIYRSASQINAGPMTIVIA